MTRSKKLTRQFSKILGSEDAEQQLNALAETLRPQPAFAGYLPLIENFSRFADAIDESYAQFDDKVRMAVRNLELSSQELNVSNRTLEQLSGSIRAMLESLDQGLLIFDETGTCSPIFSKRTLELLHTDPSHKPIWEVLGLDAQQTENMRMLLPMLFTGTSALGFDDLVSLAPQMFVYEGVSNISLMYRPMKDAKGKLVSLLVIATDRTQELEAAKRLKQTEMQAMSTLRIVRNRNNFINFIQQFRRMFDELESGQACWISAEQVKRDIHTLKGLAGMFYVTELERTLNALESDLGRIPKDTSEHEHITQCIQHHRIAIWREFGDVLQIAQEILGEGFEESGQSIAISSLRLYAFAEELKTMMATGVPAEQVNRQFLERLVAVPIHRQLADFDAQLHELAERFGKLLRPTRFLGQNFSLLCEPYQAVMTSLVHLARNIIDHGLSDPRTREQLGKPRFGQVTITTGMMPESPGWFRITIADDGEGIDTEALRRALQRRAGNAWRDMDDEELIQQIFTDEVSTRSEQSELSGRGVGMSAVKADVERMNGTIRVESVLGKGVTVHIELPVMWDIMSGW